MSKLISWILPPGYGIQRGGMLSWRMVRRNGIPSSNEYFTIYGAAMHARRDYIEDMEELLKSKRRWEDIKRSKKKSNSKE